MAISVVFIGILIMLDVLFFVNYLAVRWLRTWTDENEEQLALSDESSVASKSSSNNTSTTRNQPSIPSLTKQYTQAFFMGVVHREPTKVMKFEKWRDLPYACGKWSTVALLLFSLSLLSVEFKAHDTVSKGMEVSSKDLCMATNFTGKINRFEEQMNTVANLDMAKKQFNWTEGFYEALDADTSLYGTDGYECPSGYGLSGSKYDWADTNETFFPGYCTARMRAEISNASKATCTHRQCKCAKVFGLIEVCWLAKVCLDVGDSCPVDTTGLETDLNDYYSESGELYGAETQNQANMNKTFPSMSSTVSTAAAKTIEKVLYQFNVLSVAYAFYSLLALFFPAPLLMFRLPYGYYIKRYLFGIHKPTFILFMLALWWGVEYFKPFWMSPEIQLYLSMLRIGDPCLFDSDFISAKLSVIKGVCEELVTMEGQFVTNTLTINRLVSGVGLFANSCNCSFPNQNLIKFQTPRYIFVAQARELGFVNEVEGLCEPPYCNRIFIPPQNNAFLGDMSICKDTTLARHYLFTAANDDVKTNWWWLLWSTGFLSKILVKVVATNFCISLYYLGDPLSSCGGRFDWPPSYLFRARGDDQTVNSNGGSDRSSITGMSSNEAMKLRQRKTTCLRIIFFKWTVIWGILTHLCLINLALAPIEDEEISRVDVHVTIIFLIIALMSINGLIGLHCFLKRRGFHVKRSNRRDHKKPLPLRRKNKDNDRSSPLLETASTESSSTESSSTESSASESLEVTLSETFEHTPPLLKASSSESTTDKNENV